MTTSLQPASWTAVLSARGLRALPQSQFVPVDAWLLDPRSPSYLLRLVARGTQVRLMSYDRSDLTILLLRAECDCEAHRQAGAAGRPALRPGAQPVTQAVYDGAEREGWHGVEAGLLRPDDVAPVLDRLLSVLEAAAADAALATRSA